MSHIDNPSAGGGGGGAPTDAEYLTAAAHAGLTAERVATSTPTVAWDFATAGQAKANVPAGAVSPAAHAASHADGGSDEVGLDASQVITGRFGLARLTDAAANQVLRAQGVGVSPAYGLVVTNDIADSQITDPKIRTAAALSVIGRAASLGGVVADIVAAASGMYLQRNTAVVKFDFIQVADLPVHDILTKHNGFPGGTTNFLREDGTWVQPSGGGGSSVTRIAGASGAAGADLTWQNLTADAADVTTTALSAAIMSTTGVGAGTWKFKYTLICQCDVAAAGIGFGVNHTGTVGKFRAMCLSITTGATAATGVIDDDTATVAGQMAEGKQEGVLNAVIGSTFAGAATVDADFMVIVEGILVVTATGTMELKISSETAGSAVRVMADSVLELHKIE